MENQDVLRFKELQSARAPLNLRRGLFFLKLAVEQIRCFNSIAAEILLRDYLEPLHAMFEHNISSIDSDKMDRSSQVHEISQQLYGEHIWQALMRIGQIPSAPPGFGLSELGLAEASPTSNVIEEKPGKENQTLPPPNNFTSPWSSSLELGVPNNSKRLANSNILNEASDKPVDTVLVKGVVEDRSFKRDFGPIAPPKPSEILAARMARQSTTASSSASSDHFFDQVPNFRYMEDISSRQHPQASQAAARSNDSEPGRAKEGMASESPNSSDSALQDILSKVPHALADNITLSPGSRYKAKKASAVPEITSREITIEPSRWTTGKDVTSQRGSLGSEEFNNGDDGLETHDNPISGMQRSHNDENSAPSTTRSSWAQIAAIPDSNKNGNGSHIKLMLATPGTRAAVPVAAAATAVSRKENTTSQLRVVWLANLPSNFGLRDVSAQINEGAIMSILLQRDAHQMLPGLSACVIFMNAADAGLFLSNNNYSLSTGKTTGPTKYAQYFQAHGGPLGTNNIAGTQANSLPPTKDATIMQGSSYPLESDKSLQSMFPPTNARRRIKWSRSRLFYDVSIRQFKIDVISLVGGKHNIEFFHFYNPGECTVVFSSVGVATVCLEGFENLKRGRCNRRDVITSGTSARGELARVTAGEVTTLEEEGRPGGMLPGRMDGKKNRYEGVDVGYVRDFNEARPESLWSQYGRDGKLRASSRMDGCEGLFEGPEV